MGKATHGIFIYEGNLGGGGRNKCMSIITAAGVWPCLQKSTTEIVHGENADILSHATYIDCVHRASKIPHIEREVRTWVLGYRSVVQ